MRHRGPEFEGFWTSEPDARGRGVLLAHRRLPILDLTDAAAQPMVDPGTGDVLVANGEIYNYVALRSQLVADGQRMRSTGDTAVLLRSLSLHGRQAIPSLRGMFALAFWDARRRQLLLARDALGIKPLYIARNPDPNGDWSMVFASELRAILASGLLGKPKLNPRAVASMVWNGFVMSPDTAVEGIESVWPGDLHLFDDQGRELLRESFAELPGHDGDGSMDEASVTQALEDSVRLHLAADAPLGVLLSGGVDSSAMANLAQQFSAEPIKTFTLAFEEQQHNEGVYSRRIAKAIGSQHQELLLTERRFLDGLEAALHSLDQPSFDGLNTYFTSQAVRDAGVTVVLAGTGGDELFGGYRSFHALPALLRGAARAKWVPRRFQMAAAQVLASLMQSPHASFPRQTRWSKLPEMVRHSGDLLALYQMSYALFVPESQRDLLGDAAAGTLVNGLPPAMHARVLRETQGRSTLSAISVMEQRLFLGERLLRDSDAVSMAASVELRLPLVDQVLFQHVDRLPMATRYGTVRNKALLRRIGLRGLDPVLFERPKQGFTLPYDQWLRGDLGQVVGRLLCDAQAVRNAGLNPLAVRGLWKAFVERAPGLYWSRIWALYVLVHWCERHGVSI